MPYFFMALLFIMSFPYSLTDSIFSLLSVLQMQNSFSDIKVFLVRFSVNKEYFSLNK